MGYISYMSTLGTIVGKSAPVIGGILNSVLPGSSLIVSGLMSLFGVKNYDELENAIQTDPESALKLKQFELQHIEELEKIASQDRNSARNREIEITKAKGGRDWLFTFVVMSVVFGFLGAMALVGLTAMDKTDHDIFWALLGVLTTKFGSVVDYFVGLGSHLGGGNQRANSEVILPPPAQTR